MHIAKASTARMKSKGARGAALLDASLRVNPSPLRPTVHQDGEGGGRNTLFHPTHTRLLKSFTSEDVPEKASVKRVIGLSKVHLPHKTGGANSTSCCYNLLCHHYTIRHLMTRNKGRLEGLINDGSIPQSRLANIFAKIRCKELDSEIGRKSTICSAP